MSGNHLRIKDSNAWKVDPSLNFHSRISGADDMIVATMIALAVVMETWAPFSQMTSNHDLMVEMTSG